MAYSSTSAYATSTAASGSCQATACAAGSASGVRRSAAGPFPSSPPLDPRSSECDHQLEKLEFALAVAITRGDAIRIDHLRGQIAALGGNSEEPGT